MKKKMTICEFVDCKWVVKEINTTIKDGKTYITID